MPICPDNKVKVSMGNRPSRRCTRSCRVHRVILTRCSLGEGHEQREPCPSAQPEASVPVSQRGSVLLRRSWRCECPKRAPDPPRRSEECAQCGGGGWWPPVFARPRLLATTTIMWAPLSPDYRGGPPGGRNVRYIPRVQDRGDRSGAAWNPAQVCSPQRTRRSSRNSMWPWLLRRTPGTSCDASHVAALHARYPSRHLLSWNNP